MTTSSVAPRRVLQRLGGYGLSEPDLQGRISLMNCRGQGGYVRDAILSRVKALKSDFVIIDPRYKLMRPDEDENTGSGLIGILNLLDAIAEENAAVMIVSRAPRSTSRRRSAASSKPG